MARPDFGEQYETPKQEAAEKRMGIKEGSKQDKALDKKRVPSKPFPFRKM